MKKTIICALLFFTVLSPVFSQEFYRRDIKYVDTATFMVWASPNFSVQIPFGKGYLATTFEHNYSIGLDFTFKTKTNWTIDVGFNYMFGSKIKKQCKDVVGDMAIEIVKDTTYAFFSGAGNNLVLLAWEGRYWNFGASFGKIIPLNRWKNSGLWLKFGMGYFGHKIYFNDTKNLFPQIALDKKKGIYYRYGYDQHASGVALNQFFGYLFMQKRRALSFYAGIECWEIFSKPDRGYIFVGELKGKTDRLPRKFSGLVGFKIGWVLPFYEKTRTTTLYTF